MIKFSGSSVGSVQSVRSSHGSSEVNNNLIFKASKYKQGSMLITDSDDFFSNKSLFGNSLYHSSY